MHVEGTFYRLVSDSRRFFRRSRIVHLCLSITLLAISAISTAFSTSSDGSSHVPYYFSGYISGAWHLFFIGLCQLCAYYMSSSENERCKRSGTLVQAYSVISSFFVLFNVMGVVFVVVNGICISDMMCYYTKHETVNQSMAVVLIILHSVSILSSVFLAKRAHLIECQIKADISVKLMHTFDFVRRRTRHNSEKCGHESTSTDAATSIQDPDCSCITTDADTSMSQSNTSRDFIVSAEVSVSSQKIIRPRSKSHSNLNKKHDAHEQEMEPVSSVHSDSETNSDRKERKRKHFKSVCSKNRVGILIINKKPSHKNTDYDNYDSDSAFGINHEFATSKTQAVELKERRQHFKSDSRSLTPVNNDSTEKLTTMQSEILRKQENLQKLQEELLEQQRTLCYQQHQIVSPSQSQPPPYDFSCDQITVQPADQKNQAN